jgi:hypothetical protein
VWFAWGAENDEIQVPKKSAETGGHQFLEYKISKCPVCVEEVVDDRRSSQIFRETAVAVYKNIFLLDDPRVVWSFIKFVDDSNKSKKTIDCMKLSEILFRTMQYNKTCNNMFCTNSSRTKTEDEDMDDEFEMFIVLDGIQRMADDDIRLMKM